MKSLSNRNKLKAFIAPNMIYLIVFLDNNRKLYIYTGETFMNSIFIYKLLDTQLT